MGLERVGVSVFEWLRSRGGCRGTLLTLGRQHLYLRESELPRGMVWPEAVPREPETEIFADPLFLAMGFDRVESLDYAPYEGCDLVHDLNEAVPRDWHERADVVFDGGTLEHVFHFPNAIANAMNLVRSGGYFVSATPCNGCSGHGFYQFSPELFYRLFQAGNGFEIRLMALAELRPRGRLFRVEDPGNLGHRITFTGRGPLYLMVVARRTGPMGSDTPTLYQSDYAVTWRKAPDPPPGGAPSASTSPVVAGRSRSRLRAWVSSNMPRSLVRRYQTMAWERRARTEAWRGVREVPSLEDCGRG